MIPIEESVFLSDIELTLDKKDTILPFLNFLIKIKNMNKTPVILGDFFEYYSGKKILNNYHFQNLLSFLKNKQIKIYLIPGNREALIKNELEFNKNNFHILNKNIEVNINGYNILLTHGDEILEEEVSHILFKKSMCFIKEKNIDEKVPTSLKSFVGTLLRRISRGHTKKKKNTLNTNKLYNLSKYNVVIMGHYDYPKEINIKVGNKITKIYILGKWAQNKPILTYNNGFRWITITN